MPSQIYKHYKTVVGNTKDTLETTIPNGETWRLGQWVGSANPTRDTYVALVWDMGGASEEYLALTHTSEKHDIGKEITGDGSKKISICLVNDTADTETLGAQYTVRTI